MIAIQKCPAPTKLVLDGEKHAGELCAAYKAGYRKGDEEMAIRASIYKSVKPELEACHRGKCCYCEARFKDHQPFVYSEVEHWRPKASYYWLVYSWDNLLLCCGFCNKQKLDEFPLADPNSRATDHEMSIDAERPSILKPDGGDDPRFDITFEGDRPVRITERGQETIRVLDLDSPKHANRRDYLTELTKKRKLWIDLMDNDDPRVRFHAEAARKFVEDSPHPDRPYSAMAAAFLKANPLPQPAAMKVMTAGEMPPDFSNAE